MLSSRTYGITILFIINHHRFKVLSNKSMRKATTDIPDKHEIVTSIAWATKHQRVRQCFHYSHIFFTQHTLHPRHRCLPYLCTQVSYYPPPRTTHIVTSYARMMPLPSHEHSLTSFGQQYCPTPDWFPMGRAAWQT